MKLIGNEDLRVQKTIDAIYKAFEIMICSIDYKKMTVKELCEIAKINKKTFYRYYSTLDDLFIELRNSMTDDFIKRMEKFNIPKDIDKMIREFFIFAEEKGKLFERITCNVNYVDTCKEMSETIMEKILQPTEYMNQYNYYEQNIITAYIGGSSVKIYSQWVADGKKIPLEDIIKLTINLIYNGFNEYKN